MLDTLIRGAKIVDGTGKAAFTADVGILDGMIEAVGNLSGAQAFETIEAAGRVLTPGFIDMHRHADAALFREGFGEAELCQGLTTLVNGNSHSHTGGQLTGTADDRERRRYGAIHSGGVHKQEPVCRLYTVLCAIIFLKIFVQIRSADLLYI